MFRGFLMLAAAIAAALGAVDAGAQSLKVGAAKRVVTPDPLLPVSGGVGTPSPVTEKRGDLFARAMVLEKGDTRVAIACVDFLGWPQTLCDKTRALVPRIPAENILIGSTHNHSGPDPYAFPDLQGGHGADLEYLDRVTEQLADAINEALDNLQPAHLKINVKEIEGKIAYNYYAPQLYDPRCGVIQAVKAEGPDAGQPIVTMVNYAIHPEVLGPGVGLLSPDLCGPLYDRIEEKTGGMALFMNGALGGMITADNRRPDGGSDRTWEECVRIGELLADRALEVIAKAEPQKDPVLYCAARTIRFPLDSKLMRYILEKSPMGYDIGGGDEIPTQLNLLNIGTAQVLTIPGEALPNIGYYLKRNMNAKHQFLFGLTNDAFGYILTKEDFNSFKRYEYISRTSLGEMTGEVFMREALDLVAASPKADGAK